MIEANVLHFWKRGELSLDTELVVPGETLASSKEYKAGYGTYLSNGEIRAKILGIKMVDEKSKTIYVLAFKDPKSVRNNSIVIGEVISVSNTIANIKLYGVFDDGVYNPLISPLSATLHITQLGIRVSKLSDYLKVGDVVRAKVILDRTLPLSLSVAGPELGVVAAYCGLCGGSMKIRDKRKHSMKCAKCGSLQNRKLSRFYDFDRYTRIIQVIKPRHYEALGE